MSLGAWLGTEVGIRCKVKAVVPAASGHGVRRSSVGRGGATGEGRGFIRGGWPA